MDTATPVGHPEASAAFTHSAAARSRWRLPRQARHALLTAHIVVSVGLLGDTVGYLTIAARAATDDDPAAMRQSAHILNLFSMLFGIPLSFAALLTGIGLGLGTRWGVLRHPWVVAKLALVLSVLLDGVDRTRTLVIAATYDVIALTTATALSVFKPGGPFRRTTQTRATG
jgi:hypothetical protein